nr:response regulator [Caballeronia sp. GAWG1-1]
MLPAVLDAESPLVVEQSDSPHGNGEWVLVVEDDPEVRRTVSDMLGTLNFRTVEAENADAAATILRAGHPVDFLFTDVVMPGNLSGTELAAMARQTHPDVAILFTSGYAESRIAHGGLIEAGVQLLSKPYTHQHSPVRYDVCLQWRPRHRQRQVRMPRLMLVEDDDNLREATLALLSTSQSNVVAFETAEAALDAIEADGLPDVLLTDIGLPGMGGIELAEMVRENSSLPVIFLTGMDVAARVLRMQKCSKYPKTIRCSFAGDCNRTGAGWIRALDWGVVLDSHRALRALPSVCSCTDLVISAFDVRPEGLGTVADRGWMVVRSNSTAAHAHCRDLAHGRAGVDAPCRRASSTHPAHLLFRPSIAR